MEGAPLRPVPTRPAAPVDLDEAGRHVRARIPSLDEHAATALAVVELGGRTRQEAAAHAEVSPTELAAALARGRKALRRSLYPLPGSGWCERAERMLSDRLDGELRPPGPARLDAHLANCPRCVEHDLRLAQAIDALTRRFVDARPVEERPTAGAAPPKEAASPPTAAPPPRPGHPVPPAPLPTRPAEGESRAEEPASAATVRPPPGAERAARPGPVEPRPPLWQPTPAYTRVAGESRPGWTAAERAERSRAEGIQGLATYAVLAFALLFALVSTVISLSTVF